MALSDKAAKATLATIIGGIVTCTNPNYEKRDLLDPLTVGSKVTYGHSTPMRNTMYGLGYVAFIGGAAGVGYLALRGKLKE